MAAQRPAYMVHLTTAQLAKVPSRYSRTSPGKGCPAPPAASGACHDGGRWRVDVAGPRFSQWLLRLSPCSPMHLSALLSGCPVALGLPAEIIYESTRPWMGEKYEVNGC